MALTHFSVIFPLLCGLSYVVAGISFFLDSSHSTTPGSEEYWNILAESEIARQTFLIAFALTGIFALGAIKSIQEFLGSIKSSLLHWAFSLGYLGYAVTAVNYFRILGGESRRAVAYSIGNEATRDAIASFSIAIDTQGWLMFGAVGIFLAIVNGFAWKLRSWPRWISGLGMVIAVLNGVAWFGLLTNQGLLVNFAAGVGGIVLGPVWWGGIGVVFWSHISKTK